LTRGLIAPVLLTVASLVDGGAWGDARSVLRYMQSFRPLLAIAVLLLTIWNYSVTSVRRQYVCALNLRISKLDSRLLAASAHCPGCLSDTQTGLGPQ
jgi:hypothetical protein